MELATLRKAAAFHQKVGCLSRGPIGCLHPPLPTGRAQPVPVPIASRAAAHTSRQLRMTPSVDLRALRIQRRAHTGYAQRVIVGFMFVLICAPVIARYVCGPEHGRTDDRQMNSAQTTCR